MAQGKRQQEVFLSFFLIGNGLHPISDGLHPSSEGRSSDGLGRRMSGATPGDSATAEVPPCSLGVTIRCREG